MNLFLDFRPLLAFQTPSGFWTPRLLEVVENSTVGHWGNRGASGVGSSAVDNGPGQ